MTWYEGQEDIIIIPLPNDFDIDINLDYLTREKNELLYEIDNGNIRRAIAIGEDRFLIQISVIDNKEMVVQILNETKPTEPWQQDTIVMYIREWFDLDTDLTPFYEMAKADPLLQKPAQDYVGLRIIGIHDLFEALCWGVLGQQINLAFAYSLKRQFVEQFGDFIEWNGKQYWMFPSHEKIAQLNPSDLETVQMTARKREFIVGIARLIASGVLSKQNLLSLNFKDAEKKLINIRGIGPWTANYVLMRCLRFPTAFPIDDVGLINSIKALRNMDRKPTKEEILKLASPWKDWEAYATFYLWRVLY
ncbi:DNA-3-methyladenine glycosylase [Ornithinibacillus sp. L9]|uniref:DNA-3-methyladenine glycosylase II n=1 Tax=Ornithinibacillus caprae TaxID=2678566 RepID=A0A6N8FIC0_9BACI|nr:DNA-3-methyladenine glycosylase [Ornithinibacillus caprae]MUK87787.1 DNA-3-methyladenine glycosylase [Ornithinibacillus caprae]